MVMCVNVIAHAYIASSHWVGTNACSVESNCLPYTLCFPYNKPLTTCSTAQRIASYPGPLWGGKDLDEATQETHHIWMISTRGYTSSEALTVEVTSRENSLVMNDRPVVPPGM